MSDITKLGFEQFIELHVRQNLSLQVIGDMYQVSRQRIHQIKKQFESKHGKINRKQPLDSFTLKKQLDEGLSTQEIASRFDVKPSKVNRLIRKYEEDYKNGLSPVKVMRKKCRDVLSKGLLYQLYVSELKNDKEIAEMYGISAASVCLLRKEYGIATLYSKKLRKLPQVLTKETFYQCRIVEGLSLKEMATQFDCHLTSIVKLEKKYNIKK